MKDGYQNIVSKMGISLLGLIYIGVGMSFFIFLHSFNIWGLWLALIATWVTDTGAFFVGKFVGKRKLSPGISPNKTIEGALGGVLFTTITVTFIALYLDKFSFYWIIYSIMVALIAISGDLFESSLKRDMEVKDSGRLIPGHGGILDRFDSLLFTIPFTYFYLFYLNVFLK
jgi:phosphatidate cytidylyltransferase